MMSFVWIAFGLILSSEVALSSEGEPVDFGRQIQPILAKKCYACHGPDEAERQADLRLDQRESAIDAAAIVPGDPEISELIRRVFSDDPDEQMPPPELEQLSDAEKVLLRQWVEQGAEYTVHWSFVLPERNALPDVSDPDWCRNTIDRFVLARLEENGLTPSPDADRDTLIRRVSLDLTGLPPTPEEADRFANDHSPDAYEKLVDRLLASPDYGERWARAWLDLARYADTNGYEKDRERSIWPYRDWVIKALNADMPYDRFSVEQLAGDLLPEATTDQKIATGFHRNTMLNEEGGIDPLEFRFYAMVDRVATTGLVWMGLTTGCAQCHSHKYDPISHTDYYRLMALLNNADEPDFILDDAETAARQQQIEESIRDLEAKLPENFPATQDIEGGPDESRKAFEKSFSNWLAEQQRSAVEWTVVEPISMETNLPRLEVLEDGSIFSTGDITKRDVFDLRFDLSKINERVTAIRLEVLPDDRLPARGPGRCYYEGRQGDFFLSEMNASANGASVPFSSGSHSYGKISIGSGSADAANVFDNNGSTGWSTAGQEGEANHLVLNFAEPMPLDAILDLQMVFERHFAASLGRFRLSVTTQPSPVEAKPYSASLEAILADSRESLEGEELAKLRQEYLYQAPELEEARKPIEKLRSQIPDPVSTLIFRERPEDNPRPTFRHHRGEYLSPREEVSAGVPKMFPPIDPQEAPDRLALANWLVSERNPLVARVVVNRAWRSFFGEGLVRTNGDYGTQSEPPTHPELLDTLAVEFVERGWSLKYLHRLIVLSRTYRQQSGMTPELLKIDPENRLLARGPRFRLDAEIVRDSLLASADLLSRKMLGRSVYPPQPESVTALAYGNAQWPISTGEDRYRKSLYTFSKRTAPFAAFAVFDAPSGENCLARRDRSNTPLQALTLLNDEMFQEMARALAKETMAREELTTSQRIEWIFRRLLVRKPTDGELIALISFYDAQINRLSSEEINASQITATEEPSPELAACTMVTRALMNLDETVTKP